MTTYSLIDSGSDVTMIDPSLVQQLGIQGEEEQLLLSTVSQRDRQEKGGDLTIPLKHVTARKKLEQLSHLRHVPFPEVERKKVSILIETSLQEAFIRLEVKKGRSHEPFAIRSCLGWSILGGCVSVSSKRQFNLNHVSSEDVSLNRQLEEFWQIESCGTVKELWPYVS